MAVALVAAAAVTVPSADPSHRCWFSVILPMPQDRLPLSLGFKVPSAKGGDPSTDAILIFQILFLWMVLKHFNFSCSPPPTRDVGKKGWGGDGPERFFGATLVCVVWKSEVPFTG